MSAEERFKEVSSAFVGALHRLIRVSTEDEEGRPTAVTRTRLSEEADVGRSTLAKYLSPQDGQAANPTLDVVCRLAHTLGVPPAFLLMTADDWSRLARAAISFAQMAGDERFVEFAEQAMAHKAAGPQTYAEAGLTLGRLLGLHSPSALPLAATPRRGGIPVTCAAPPFREMSAVSIPVLLALCTVIGASTNPQGE